MPCSLGIGSVWQATSTVLPAGIILFLVLSRIQQPHVDFAGWMERAVLYCAGGAIWRFEKISGQFLQLDS